MTNTRTQERKKVSKRAWRVKNREKVNQYKRSYRAANKEKHARMGKAYREANREKISQYRQSYHTKNRFRVSLRSSQAAAKREGYAPCVASEAEVAAAFKGECHVCGVSELELKRRLHLDHDHKTGKFRGWLCHHCNLSLGNAGDSPERLESLARYAREHQQQAR